MTTGTTGSTQRRAAIIHGYGATPEDHWFGWLAEQLRADGFATTVPALPDSQAPDPAVWAEALRARPGGIGTPDEHTAVVAHSLGCLTVLRHLRSLRRPWRLGALVLVAGFVDRLPVLPELDGYIADGCDVTGLRDQVDRLTVIRSDDDMFVPPGHTDRLAGLLGVTAQVVPGAGHFLADDGVTELPEALAAVRQEPAGRRWRAGASARDRGQPEGGVTRTGDGATARPGRATNSGT